MDEVAEIMAWGFNYMQADDGGAVYLPALHTATGAAGKADD